MYTSEQLIDLLTTIRILKLQHISDWLTHWLIDWLIDWLTILIHYSRHYHIINGTNERSIVWMYYSPNTPHNSIAWEKNAKNSAQRTCSQYSPISQRMLALAMGTVIFPTSLAKCFKMSLCVVGWSCSSFLITQTLSPTTLSSRLLSSATSPLKQVSVTSAMVIAHRPMAWIVQAINSRSEVLI